MQITKVEGFDKLFPTLITLDIHNDHRGSFTELWKSSFLRPDEHHRAFVCMQSNLSRNTLAGTFRGLHFQTFLPQKKLINVISGRIIDIIVDVRLKSKTIGKFKAFDLSPGESLLVPEGFAHGFLTLQADTVVNYLVEGFRFIQHERIINILDESILDVDNSSTNLLEFMHDTLRENGMQLSDLIMSDKDRYAPLLIEQDYDTLKNASLPGTL